MAAVWDYELPKEHDQKKSYLQKFEIGIVLGVIEGDTLWGATKKTLQRIRYTIHRTSAFYAFLSLVDKMQAEAELIKNADKLKFEDPLWVKVESAIIEHLKVIDAHTTSIAKTGMHTRVLEESTWNPRDVFVKAQKTQPIEQLLAQHLAAQTQMLSRLAATPNVPKASRATQPATNSGDRKRKEETINCVQFESDEELEEEIGELNAELVSALQSISAAYDEEDRGYEHINSLKE